MAKSAPITTVEFFRDNDKNLPPAKRTKYAAKFQGHLSDSEVQRQMLFQKKTPLRNVVGFEHGYTTARA